MQASVASVHVQLTNNNKKQLQITM